jgi:hypothetical protein
VPAKTTQPIAVEVVPARDQVHVGSAAREGGARVRSDRARTEHGDFHAS